MEHDREPRNKPMHLWPIYLQQKIQEYTMGKRHSLQYVVLGKLDSYMEKKTVRSKIILGNFHTTLSKVIRITGHKINKEIEELKNTIKN